MNKLEKMNQELKIIKLDYSVRLKIKNLRLKLLGEK